ncbi:MAG: CRISPR-associated endonuclease Cas1 [Dehalococcoidia bacterium]|nr:CRISPR-associated endonuclease Cas1 [Dehalococcoidia bacterium]
MRTHSTSTNLPAATIAPSRDGILVLSGYGITVRVDRGHLILQDGVGRQRRQGRLHRATSHLTRLVVLGHAGTVSLDALRWLYDIGASFIQLDHDGTVLVATGHSREHPQLRRAQALAPWTGIGTALTAELLRRKLQGHIAVVRPLEPGTADTISELTEQLQPTLTVDALRQVEAQAGALYWQALASTLTPFARRDVVRVPAHWQTLGPRTSPLSKSPRKAVTPGHAVLNYLYALVEAEARVACLAVGLDPALGVLHTDLRYRDSLACDLMEAVRPEVDRWLLQLVARRPFAKQDCFETRAGQCRLLPPLTHELAETLPLWAQAVAPVAEHAARLLIQETRLPATDGPRSDNDLALSSSSRDSATQPLPTPLTQAKRSAGRPSNQGTPRIRQKRPALPAKRCLQCGRPLRRGKARLCGAACRERYAQEVRIPLFAEAGPAKLAALRAQGQNPTSTPEAQRKRAATQRERAAARKKWDREHEGEVFDPMQFTRDILPHLQDVPLGAMMTATGLSPRYCSEIRRGIRVPHPMHWAVLGHTTDAV